MSGPTYRYGYGYDVRRPVTRESNYIPTEYDLLVDELGNYILDEVSNRLAGDPVTIELGG